MQTSSSCFSLCDSTRPWEDTASCSRMKHSAVLPCHLGSTRRRAAWTWRLLGWTWCATDCSEWNLCAPFCSEPCGWFPAPPCHFCVSWNESFGPECSNSVPWFPIFIRVLLQPQRDQLPLCAAPELWWCLSTGWTMWFWLGAWWDEVMDWSFSHIWQKRPLLTGFLADCSDKWEENTARQSNKHCNSLSRICRAKWIMQKPGKQCGLIPRCIKIQFWSLTIS